MNTTNSAKTIEDWNLCGYWNNFFSVIVNEAYAICAAEILGWWKACNDIGFANALPLNPALMLVMFVAGISATSFAGIVILIRIYSRQKIQDTLNFMK